MDRYGANGRSLKICDRVWFGGLREGGHRRNQNDCNSDRFDRQFHTKHFPSWLDSQRIVLGRSESRIVGVGMKSQFFQCTFAKTAEILLWVDSKRSFGWPTTRLRAGDLRFLKDHLLDL